MSSDPADLQAVLDAELAYLQHHRHPEQHPAIVRRSLIGLALSGGGIRSATTNLGILQALASMRILPMVDYLSTVSGGGYIGACFSSLLSWNNTATPTPLDPRAAFTFDEGATPAFSTERDRFPFRADHSWHPRDDSPRADRSPAGQVAPAGGSGSPHPRAGNDVIAHLRTHGNFLIAHRGLFRRDALRGIGALTVGMVYNIAGFLVILFTASAFYLAGVLAVGPSLDEVLSWPAVASALPDTARPPLLPADSSIVRTRQEAGACPSGTAGCVTETDTPLHPPAIGDAIARNVRTVGLVFGTAWGEWGAAGARWWNRALDIPTQLRPIFLAFALGGITAIVLLLWMRARLAAYLRSPTPEARLAPGDSVEEKFERDVLRNCTFVLLIATAVAVGVGQMFWRASITGANEIVWLFAPFAALAGAVLVAFFAVTVVLPGGAKWTRRSRSLSSAFYAIASWGFYIMLAIAIAPLAIFAMRDYPVGAGIGAVGSLIVTRFLAARGPGTGKRFSLSPGALRLVLGVFVFLLLAFGTVFFAALVAGYTSSSGGAAIAGLPGFALLAILGWLVDHNKLGPQFFYRDRLAETYLFSELPDERGKLRMFRDAMEMPLDVLHGRPGDANATWRNPAPYHLISAAINLAGSRDLTRKDRKSGYWLFSKLYCGSTHTGFRPTHAYRGGRTKLATAVSVSGAAASSAIGRDTFFAQAFATVLFNIRLGSWLENPAHEKSITSTEGVIFWPRYLIREVTMDTTESARLVNLSDGGHTGDNLGIYPLLQRRCKVIIACDAERDPQLSFGSFTEALRHAYVDLGIDVDIDLTMLRADPATGLSRSHCAVGRIHYPDRRNQESFLIYLKNSLIGTESEPVLNYKVTCPDFPHETTADQFFDDAQFESYRALGVHIAEHAFGHWVGAPAFEAAQEHHTPGVTANA